MTMFTATSHCIHSLKINHSTDSIKIYSIEIDNSRRVIYGDVFIALFHLPSHPFAGELQSNESEQKRRLLFKSIRCVYRTQMPPDRMWKKRGKTTTTTTASLQLIPALGWKQWKVLLFTPLQLNESRTFYKDFMQYSIDWKKKDGHLSFYWSRCLVMSLFFSKSRNHHLWAMVLSVYLNKFRCF